MKRSKSSLSPLVYLALATTAMVALAAPSYAQSTVPQDLATRAQDACVTQAQSKGFTLQDVVTVEPADADTVRVVLSLTRDGQLYKLTCGYSKTSNSVMVDENAASRLYTPWLNPWLGVLLSLLGLLGLALWAKGRDSSAYARFTGSPYIKGTEAIVHTNGELLDIHAAPGATHRVVGNLRNGQRVTLSGRHENQWVELVDGGWIPNQAIEAVSRFATH